MQSDSKIWNFPTTHAIKAIGFQTNPIETSVLQILESLALRHEPKTVQSKVSSSGKYISITVQVNFTQMSQVEQLFAALHKHPHIVQSL